MATKENARPGDCLSCRIVGAVGMVGIGAYLANSACKIKTLPGKYGLSALSFGNYIFSMFFFYYKYNLFSGHSVRQNFGSFGNLQFTP